MTQWKRVGEEAFSMMHVYHECNGGGGRRISKCISETFPSEIDYFMPQISPVTLKPICIKWKIIDT